MKAAVLRGKGRLVVEEVPTPRPGPGQVLVKIAYCGICGSDLHFFDHEQAPSGTVLGHEWSGTVAEVGPGVEGFALGNRVTMGGLPVWLAPEHPDLHPVAYAGGYAEYLCYHTEALHRLPDGVTLEEGALTDTLGVGLAAVNRVAVPKGGTALVIGAGPIGLATLLAARLAGAGRVIVTEMAGARKEAARRLGADLVLDPAEGDVERRILEASPGGAGVDVAYECAGVPSTIQQAVNMVRVGGRVGLVGVTFGPAEILPAVWYLKAVTVSAIPGGDLRAALELLGKRTLDVNPLVSHVVGLDHIQETFEALLRPTDQLKVLVRPSEETDVH